MVEFVFGCKKLFLRPLCAVNITSSPREGGGKGCTKEVDAPGDDHVVVVDDEHCIEQVRQTDALEEGDAAEDK